MKLLPAIAAISCLTGLSLAPAQAATINYNEGASGDLDFDYIGTFMPGLNTVVGSTAANSPVGVDDFDVFSFDVAAGSQVNSVTYAYINVVPNAGSDGFGLGMDASFGDLGTWEIDVRNNTLDGVFQLPPMSILGESVPLAAGPTYDFDYYIWQFGGPASTQGGTWDYAIVFDVAPIPLPAAAWLFGSALLGMAGLAKRRKA